MKFKTLLFWSLILYWGFLLTMTHLPHPPRMRDYGDKTLHLAAYGVLAFLLSMNFQIRKMAPERIIARVVVMVIIGGAIDEWTQPLFGRTCELMDWCADVAAAGGVSTAVAMVASVFK
jgi:VanZ family protein